MRWTPKRGDPVSLFHHALLQDKSSIQNRAFMNHGGFKSDTPESYRCEFGAGGGLASAHGIAGMYRPPPMGAVSWLTHSHWSACRPHPCLVWMPPCCCPAGFRWDIC